MDRIWDLGFSLACDYKDENLGLVSKIGTVWDLGGGTVLCVINFDAGGPFSAASVIY